MLTHWLNRDKILLLIIWSFFSFSVMKVFSIFLYSISHIFLWYACLYSSLFFVYYFIFKSMFHGKLSFLQYTASNILFVILVAFFSYVYYKLIMLDNDYFTYNVFIAILVSNIVLGSLLFLLTLTKRT
jgi:hypothetical protein